MTANMELRRVDLPSDRPRIVVVADTHSKPHARAYEWIAREEPGVILHAGDIGSWDVIEALEAIAPTHAVRGNVDGWTLQAPDFLVLDLLAPSGAKLRALLTHIGVYGARLQKNVRVLAEENEAQMVVCGHSHVPLIARDGTFVVFNAGSVGPRRFGLPITFGVMDLAATGMKMRHVDCETGEAWLPPA